jgi:quinol monooxygenase YgiN
MTKVSMIPPMSIAGICRASVLLVLLWSMEAGASTPLHVVTHVDIAPDRAADGKRILREEGILSRKDPGCMSWDLLEEKGRPNHFAVVEVWSDSAAFDRHVETDHAKQMRTKLQPLLGSPFDERLHTLVD